MKACGFSSTSSEWVNRWKEHLGKRERGSGHVRQSGTYWCSLGESGFTQPSLWIRGREKNSSSQSFVFLNHTVWCVFPRRAVTRVYGHICAVWTEWNMPIPSPTGRPDLGNLANVPCKAVWSALQAVQVMCKTTRFGSRRSSEWLVNELTLYSHEYLH